ncbi:MAG: type IV secretion system DNA-binding domain-containing protein [Patescibacteria group bacterium]|nr:type IV secretion system DNA-binding domain-containing protein [Patescibacteria group bacterium]
MNEQDIAGLTAINNDWLMLAAAAAAVILALIIILNIAKKIFRAKAKAGKAFHRTIMLIKVPKERKGEKSEGGGEENINQLREQIATTETLFSTIAGLRPEKGFMAWLRGRNDHFAFEIAVKDGKISFYVAVPDKFKTFLEQQIHAQYPHAQITEEPDYNIFKPDSHIVGAYLWFKSRSAFPFKTYKHLDSDPLVALLNPLSRLQENEGALIQYIVRPAATKWRRQGVQMIRDIRAGQKFEYVARQSGFSRGLAKWKKTAFPEKKDPMKTGSTSEPYRLTQMEEEMVKNMEEKISQGGLELTVRVVSAASVQEKAKLNLENIVNAFSQYNVYRYGNSFGAIIPRKPNKLISESIYRSVRTGAYMVASTAEMASFWHMPTAQTETPHIDWLGARKAPPPLNMPTEGITLGHSVYRDEDVVVKMKRADRRRHMYVIGKSGSGKSVFIQNLAVQDVLNGEGVCVVDPHGDFAEYVLQHVPKERAEDVIYFNPADTDRPIGLNMLEVKTEEQKDFATQEMISMFYKMVTDPSMIGPMFEHQMRNVMLTLMSDMEMPGTIAEIPRMFTDDTFVESWKKKLKDPVVMAFWEKEMAKTSDFHKSEMLGYLISKVGRFTENAMVRNIIGQSHSGFSFREIMDQKKILIVNLSKGLVGEINANLLGLIIVSKIQMAAMERAQIPEEERHDFYLYMDEFQNFITDSIATILSEARKYRLELILAHQYLKQLEDNKGKTAVRDAVLGNAGTIVSYRIGVEDAEILQKEFAPVFSAYDLMNVEQYTVYIKLLIDNTAAKPFNMSIYPPQPGNKELAAAIKELSRLKYGRPREIVEAEIMERSQLGNIMPDANKIEPSL